MDFCAHCGHQLASSHGEARWTHCATCPDCVKPPQTHAEVVSARIAAFPRAVQAIRNTNEGLVAMYRLSEKDILRLAIELVR